ncbi:hypothetical protein VKT23_019131 [Stygiomarasmius scandens]|uniref:Uncharacterized protein n=1 Tax=Marasmiellus scandens TaxID=2682957 RepID=A0ABR1IM32_9AGAR
MPPKCASDMDLEPQPKRTHTASASQRGAKNQSQCEQLKPRTSSGKKSAPKMAKKKAVSALSEEEDDKMVVHSEASEAEKDLEDVDEPDMEGDDQDPVEISQEERDEKELAELKAKWKKPIYAFFDPEPTLEYRKDGRKCVVFRCSAKNCKKHEIARYLDTEDAGSTGNMHKHVKSCWGEEVLADVDKAKDVDEGRMLTASYKRNGSITASFERTKKGKVTYSYWQHTKTETR